jgi:mRNA-degrading endonuclease HigB of HigAB toxin-antitoxin module
MLPKVWFPGRTIWIKFVGTHKSYDDLDVRTL